MNKQAPGIGRMVAMAVFALSCFGILMFLWLAFGGPIPLNPEGYRFTVRVPEAATLVQEADVRMAGVNVGKVKSKRLDARGARTVVEVELDDAYAAIPKDTRAILRQKTLLGETYLELSPGHKSSGLVADGGRLADSRVDDTVELDEILSSFDRPTRRAFQDFVKEAAVAIEGGRGQDLNDAFGNFEGFAADGSRLLATLDEQRGAVRRLVRNTGQVFGALGERQGALRELVVNTKNTFEATASRDESLAETFRILPTFLDESKATMERLERFSASTRPLVNDLKGPADDLGPTVRDLGDLAPDLQRLFRDLGPLIAAGRKGVPDLQSTLGEAEPLAEGLHSFFPELNPILSYLSFHQQSIAGFITNGAADLAADYGTGQRGQTQIGLIEERSVLGFPFGAKPPAWVRANSYMAPNALARAMPLGTIESFSCPEGERRDPDDATGPGEASGDKLPPCFEAPASLYDGKRFVIPQRGRSPRRDAPRGTVGATPAVDPDPGD